MTVLSRGITTFNKSTLPKTCKNQCPKKKKKKKAAAAPPQPPAPAPKLYTGGFKLNDNCIKDLNNTQAVNYNLNDRQVTHVFNDADNGGFGLDVRGKSYNPHDPKAVGIEALAVNTDAACVQVCNDGRIIEVDKKTQKVTTLGNLNDAGLLSEIDAGNGLKVSTVMTQDKDGKSTEQVQIKQNDYLLLAKTVDTGNPHCPKLEVAVAENRVGVGENATGLPPAVQFTNFQSILA
jgi:hypothetical protein